MRRDDLAELTSLTKSWSPTERKRLTDSMGHVYDLFVERLTAGRELSPAKIEEVDRGRVWAGDQAKENGLVDELGGFPEAIDAAKKEPGIPLTDTVAPILPPTYERNSTHFG